MRAWSSHCSVILYCLYRFKTHRTLSDLGIHEMSAQRGTRVIVTGRVKQRRYDGREGGKVTVY